MRTMADVSTVKVRVEESKVNTLGIEDPPS